MLDRAFIVIDWRTIWSGTAEAYAGFACFSIDNGILGESRTVISITNQSGRQALACRLVFNASI
jgi:hypothetical protein